MQIQYRAYVIHFCHSDPSEFKTSEQGRDSAMSKYCPLLVFPFNVLNPPVSCLKLNAETRRIRLQG